MALYSDNSVFSASTSVFTAPANGTYLFRTGLTTHNNMHVHASIVAKGETVASLYGYDDYSAKQSSASAIVRLQTGDEVKVVQKTPGSVQIYGYYSSDTPRESYFMGLLLW